VRRGPSLSDGSLPCRRRPCAEGWIQCRRL